MSTNKVGFRKVTVNQIRKYRKQKEKMNNIYAAIGSVRLDKVEYKDDEYKDDN